ncbi:MAG TPA: HlyD family secretion protein [Rhizomicrobium sp.]|nr:HlyD family secretion protein [Rhizomicrobium sp.]
MTIALDAGKLRGRAFQPKLLSRKFFYALGVSAIALGATAYGYEWLTVGRFIETTDDAYVGGDVTAIAPHVAGFVKQIEVRDNQYVHAGELIMRLDDRDFRAAEDHALAAVHQDEAALSDLRAKYALQQSVIAQNNAELAARLAQESFARDDDARYQRLERAVAISRQDVERAASNDRQAQANRLAAEAGLAGAKQQLAVLAADIDQARANVAQAEADLKLAQLNLGYTEIRAPIDGYIGNRAVRVGAYVTVGSYMVSVIPSDGLWVDANFKEDQLAHIKAGEPVTVAADVLPGREFKGRVLSIAPGTGAVFSVIPPENATGNFTKIVQRVPVRIALDGKVSELGGLRPGLSIVASIDTRTYAP